VKKTKSWPPLEKGRGQGVNGWMDKLPILKFSYIDMTECISFGKREGDSLLSLFLLVIWLASLGEDWAGG